ncbi:MAG: hypothetical protein QOG64_1251, partial [Acidimicrobiaceae bacterium]|nr:hypothetical protein [Acidimicrobiaceae bacterium]
MNRRRIAALGAVAVFAAATIGVAVIAGGNDHRSRTSALAKLPIPEADSATSAGQASMAQPMGPLAYVVKGTMPALATTAPAYKISGAATGDDAARLANAIGLH